MYDEPGKSWGKTIIIAIIIALLGWALYTLVDQNTGSGVEDNKVKTEKSEKAEIENKPNVSGEEKKLETVVIGPMNIADMVEIVSPSVVNIESSRQVKGYGSDFIFNDPFFKDFFGDNFTTPHPNVETAIGTGFIISKEGLIITNQHVINEADEISVNLTDGETYAAEVIGQDYEMDLAVLKIQADKDLVPLVLGDSDTLRVGEWVIAIGNPYGLDHTVTAGLVSAKGRPMQIENRIYRDLIQTDAAINPGNSGGPLLNISGEVVGINTAVNAQAQGIGFAISINTAQEVLDELITRGKVIRPYIGIYLQPVTEEWANHLEIEQKGIMVAGVEKGSPAYDVGLRKYDVIVSIEGREVNDYDELQEVLKDHRVGDTVTLQVIRENQTVDIELKLAEKP